VRIELVLGEIDVAGSCCVTDPPSVTTTGTAIPEPFFFNAQFIDRTGRFSSCGGLVHDAALISHHDMVRRKPLRLGLVLLRAIGLGCS
jgi:hypothetical protein